MRTPMPNCDFNKVAKQLYWNHTSVLIDYLKLLEFYLNYKFLVMQKAKDFLPPGLIQADQT